MTSENRASRTPFNMVASSFDRTTVATEMQIAIREGTASSPIVVRPFKRWSAYSQIAEQERGGEGWERSHQAFEFYRKDPDKWGSLGALKFALGMQLAHVRYLLVHAPIAVKAKVARDTMHEVMERLGL